MGQKISEKQMKEEIRSVVRENIKEVTTNDWHYKAIMSIWDKGGSFTRKKIAAVLCNDPKADRRDVEDALRNSGYDEVTDVTDRLRIEGVITEKQFKGLEGIPANKSLKDISDEQKIKILQSAGNIIDFIVPKGHKRNFWQVISTGKIAKQNLSNSTVYFLTGKIIPSPSYSSIKELLANVKWDSMEERRRFNEGIIIEGEDNIPGGLAKGMTLNDIAEKHGMSVDMLIGEFKKGIQTEMEHTTDREMAKEITMDHLFEDPQYYTKLATVEEYVDDKGVEHVAAALPQTEEEPIKEEEESEETLKGLKEMAMGDLERIADYAKMILERMGSGQELDSWMYSQITLAVDQLNSVHDTMDGTDGKQEEIKEEKPGLWANIRAKQARGEAPAPKNSKAYKDAVKAGEEINKDESVNEATESDIISQIKNIAKTHQNNIVVDPKSGKKMRVDTFSASAIATVYDALSSSSKEKFLASGLLGMQQMAMKLLKK